MKTYIVLLRAINVGGTGKLAMIRLRELCEQAGFQEVRSYIQSGNLVLRSPLCEAEVQATLETLLERELGTPHGVFVRTPEQLAAVLEANPYPQAQVVFLHQTPSQDMLKELVAPDGEEVSLGQREVYIYYPKGVGRSRLKLPGLNRGTGRNLNTLEKLVKVAESQDYFRHGMENE